MSYDEAYGPIEKHYKDLAMSNTWGHLFPTTEETRGNITFCKCYYGETLVLKHTLVINDSPWLADAFSDFMNEVKIEEGEVKTLNVILKILVIPERDYDQEEIKEELEYDSDWVIPTYDQLKIEEVQNDKI